MTIGNKTNHPVNYYILGLLLFVNARVEDLFKQHCPLPLDKNEIKIGEIFGWDDFISCFEVFFQNCKKYYLENSCNY